MKLRVLCFFMAVFLIFSAGCGKSSVPEIDADEKSPGVVTTDKSGSSGKASISETDNEADENESGQVNRKIIKDGALDLETDDVNKTYANILAYAKENGGYEFSHQKTVNKDYITIEAVIKIKPEKLDAVMSYAGDVSTVINSSTSSDDITEDYYDIQTRLGTKRKTLDTYYKILKNTKELNDILTVQSEINNLIEEIEAFEGKLKMWDQLVSESSLKITISQTDDPLKPRRKINWSALSWSDMGFIISNGFTAVLNTVVTVLQWAVIVLVSASPLIVIAGIVILIIKLKNKRKHKKLNRYSQNTTENK